MTSPSSDIFAPAAPDRLPWPGLFALAMAGFVTILTEALPAGLLPQIGDSLGVSEALAGQWVSIYALGSLLAAAPLTHATASFRRRPVLLAAIAGFAVANSVTALSSVYAVTLAARFLAGARALIWAPLPLLVLALVVTLRAKRHGFPAPQSRANESQL